MPPSYQQNAALSLSLSLSLSLCYQYTHHTDVWKRNVKVRLRGAGMTDCAVAEMTDGAKIKTG